MPSTTACCFLSVNGIHRHTRFDVNLAINKLKIATHYNHHYHLCRHSDVDPFSIYQRTTSLLQSQPDDEINSPEMRDVDVDYDGDSDITSILLKPISIPFSNRIGANKGVQTVPVIYPILLIASIALLPPITSIMLTIFFVVYLTQILPFLNDYDNFSPDENEDQDAYAVVFLGAFASALLLSPQTLISPSGDENGLLSSSPYLFAALILVAFGGYVSRTGGREAAAEMSKWEEEEMDALPERRERSLMSLWDDELKEKGD